MENLEMLTGTFPVAPDQLAHDLAVAKLIKSGAVPASASGYTYYGAYIKYLREFETVIANRMFYNLPYTTLPGKRTTCHKMQPLL